MRRTGIVVLALAGALALAGCSGPDPQLVATEAQATFDDLVDHAAKTDAAVLRTLETAPPAEQACAGEDERTQTSLTATGTLSITAGQSDARRIREDLGATLDSEEWTTIHAAASDQDAWISEHDVVVTLTSDGPAVVIAVFTPCAAA